MKFFHVLILLPLLTGCFAEKVGLEDPTRPGMITLQMGPLKIEKVESDNGHNDHSDMIEKSKLFKFRQSGWITSFTPSMKDKTGAPLPSGILHHAAVADHGENDYLCKDLPHKARLMLASGSELTSFKMPEGYGIPISTKTEIAMVGMFNSKSSFEGNAYFNGEVAFSPASKGARLKDITPIWIDVVENCDPMGYKVYSTSNGRQIKDRKFRFPFSGKLMLSGGHMHAGGQRLSIIEEQTNKVIVRFDPEYDEQGNITQIPPIKSEQGISIESDTDYIIRAEYLPNAHHDIDAMGIVIAFVAEN